MDDKLLRLVRQLETATSPQEGESIAHQLLSPLLGEDGFSVTEVGPKDKGLDFIARNPFDPDPRPIAIEYKHQLQRAVGAELVARLIERAAASDSKRLLVVTNSRFTFAARERVRKADPLDVQLFDPDGLRAWIAKTSVPASSATQINVLRKKLNQELIRIVANDPSALDEIEWREMERLLTEIFDGLGFKATLTPGSKDGGKDIILCFEAASENKTYYVEVKHWRSRKLVGEDSVADFFSVLVDERVDGGLFLSTYGFSAAASESLTKFTKKKVALGGQSKIVSLCDSYLKMASGVWVPEPSEAILFSGS